MSDLASLAVSLHTTKTKLKMFIDFRDTKNLFVFASSRDARETVTNKNTFSERLSRELDRAKKSSESEKFSSTFENLARIDDWRSAYRS